MRTFLICLTAMTVLSVPVGAKGKGGAAFFDALEAGSQAEAGPAPAADGPRLRLKSSAKELALGNRDSKGGTTCVSMDIDCNSTVNSVLQTTDCALTDGTFIDFYFFAGIAGQQVTVDLESDDFDTFLFLIDPDADPAETDDDGGDGTNSRLVFTLGTSGEWSIGANNFAALTGDPGNYSLTLTCSGSEPDPPAAPSNLTATTLSSTEIDLAWQDNSGDEDDFQIQLAADGGNFSNLGSAPAGSTAAEIFNLDPETTYTFRVRARNAGGNSDWSNEASATTDPDNGEPQPCVADDETMCLNDGRFQLEVAWRVANGNTGTGKVVDVASADSGLFYFFNSDNWEMLVKVLNGCGINNRFWVFAAATTDVEYTLTVTDTTTGESKEYFNPLGQASPAITDTDAFMTCP